MNFSVIVYQIRNHKRSSVLCHKVSKGLERAGFNVSLKFESDYCYPEADMAVFYGYCNNLIKIMEEYATSIYIDLGYWERVGVQRYAGYHKLSVNGRHPTDYFQRYQHDNQRLHNIGIKPWSFGDHIVVTGMSGKGAVAEGYKPQEWETNAISVLKEHTDRPIYYRPKPSWLMSSPIEGSIYDKTHSLDEMLNGCHAVVCHHSNCAVEALIAGVPVFVIGGVARPMGLQDLKKIEKPYYPGNRRQWLQDISYCQWTPDELETSIPWNHLKSEGLI